MTLAVVVFVGLGSHDLLMRWLRVHFCRLTRLSHVVIVILVESQWMCQWDLWVKEPQELEGVLEVATPVVSN